MLVKFRADSSPLKYEPNSCLRPSPNRTRFLLIDCHFRSTFLPSQNTLLYWLGRGVDGFRFDAVNYLFEREDLADEPKSNKIGYLDTDYDSLVHTSTLDQPETYDMVREWRLLLDSYRTSERKTK